MSRRVARWTRVPRPLLLYVNEADFFWNKHRRWMAGRRFLALLSHSPCGGSLSRTARTMTLAFVWRESWPVKPVPCLRPGPSPFFFFFVLVSCLTFFPLGWWTDTIFSFLFEVLGKIIFHIGVSPLIFFSSSYWWVAISNPTCKCASHQRRPKTREFGISEGESRGRVTCLGRLWSSTSLSSRVGVIH